MRVTSQPIDTGISGWNAVLPAYEQPHVLEESLTADFVVIGAGFAGLSAARRLHQLEPTASIVLLEAKRVGEGPAGRNSGFMIDLPHELSSSDYVTTAAHDLTQIKLNRQAIRFAREMVEEYQISAEAFDQRGKVNGAAGDKASRHNVTYSRHLSGLGEPHEILDEKTMAALTGSTFYHSGLFTPGTVLLQPALYVRGVAAGLSKHIRLFENSAVINLAKNGERWEVITKMGSISAGKVIIATNGHVESFGLFKRQVFHVMLYASMTRALDEAEAVASGEANWGITPSDPAATTMRKVSSSFGSRVITRNQMSYVPSREISEHTLKRMAKRHRTAFARRYPHLKEVEQEYAWSGRLCLSRNSAPAFGEVEENLYSACCQNGLGTSRGTLSGMAIAELALEGETELAKAVLDEGKPKQLPPAPLDSIGANIIMRWNEFRAREEI